MVLLVVRRLLVHPARVALWIVLGVRINVRRGHHLGKEGEVETCISLQIQSLASEWGRKKMTDIARRVIGSGSSGGAELTAAPEI